MTERREIKPGEFGYAVMPHSEACMHLDVAGKSLTFRLSESGTSVQLYREDGSYLNFPILPGEAGVLEEDGKFYYRRS